VSAYADTLAPPDSGYWAGGYEWGETVGQTTMSESAVSPRGGIETSTRPGTDVAASGLELLSDDCAREILSVVADEPAPARRISERLDVSRTTVYRRLDRLEEAGLLDAQLAYDPDGHHRKEFRLAVDELAVTVDADGVSVECTDDDAV